MGGIFGGHVHRMNKEISSSYVTDEAFMGTLWEPTNKVSTFWEHIHTWEGKRRRKPRKSCSARSKTAGTAVQRVSACSERHVWVQFLWLVVSSLSFKTKQAFWDSFQFKGQLREMLCTIINVTTCLKNPCSQIHPTGALQKNVQDFSGCDACWSSTCSPQELSST